MILIFVPVNFALGYLIAVRLGLAPPTLKDAATEVRDIVQWLRGLIVPVVDNLRGQVTAFRARLAPIFAHGESIVIGYVEKIKTLKERFIPQKKKTDTDIGAKDLVVEPTLAEAVAWVEATPIYDQIADKTRFGTADANAAGGGKWGDGGGKGGAFMIKKRRLEQLRTGQHLIEMDKRIRTLRTAPNTEAFLQLLADFQEDGKQIETLLASLIREVKARAPYAGGRLNETVTRLDTLSAEATPTLTSLLAEVTKIETATKPAGAETPPSEAAAEGEGEAAPKPVPQIPDETIAKSLETLSPLFDKLVRLRHKIRDVQTEINTLYARLDTNFEELKPEDLINNNFNMTNRLGIESSLAEWWRTNVQSTARLCFALFDISGTHELNEELSIAVVDRICRVLGRELRIAFPQPTTLVGLFSGQCLCLATRHLSFDELRIKLQKWQTRIEATPIVCEHDGIISEVKPVLTISLVGVSAKQSEQDTYARAERGIVAAKSAKRGSFFVTSPDAAEAVAATVPSSTTTQATTPFDLKSLEMWEEIDATSAKLLTNPQDTALLIHRATTALRIGRSEIAQSDFDQAIETEPDKIIHYINRGIFRRWQKAYHTALEDFNKVFTLQPVHATALKNRAVTYFMDGNKSAADSDYQTLLELVPPKKA
ncbi:MAG: hypothetical protein ACRC46_13470 [Thermoguttaceae bacterium]